MKSIRALSFMPVVCAETGKKIGRVKSVNVDKKLLCVTGLWVMSGFGKNTFYPKETAVVISGESRKGGEGEPFSLRRALNAAGEWTGVVTNALCDEESLSIQALEWSRDVFSDLARGRRTCRFYTVSEETGDTVIDEEREGSA